MSTEMGLDTDRTILERLNQEYVDAFMNADVDWYRDHLAEDFVCIESDGSVLNKNQFLLNTAKGPDVADYKLEHVDVRIYGNAALVQLEKDFQSHGNSLVEIRMETAFDPLRDDPRFKDLIRRMGLPG